MIEITLPTIGFAKAWRAHARSLVARRVPPEQVVWRSEKDQALLAFGSAPDNAAPVENAVRAPKAFIDLAETALCADVADRFALPYALLWRLQSERGLLAIQSDPQVARLCDHAKRVRRDAHKMKAFVRFREIESEGVKRRRFMAWFEPDHFTLERTAPFFARRFGDMDWSILTPKLCAYCADGALSFAPGIMKPDMPSDDADDLWRTYFANIFNPARLKVKAMQSEMPKKYWKNLPEAELIPALIASAEDRVRAMRDAAPTQPPLRAERIKASLGAHHAV
jgi:uracil-DNA glycosylase